MIPRRVTLPFGRITLNFRAFVQYDAAIYDQDPLPGPLEVDYRRGTVVGPPSTEAIQAADMPNGGYFRRVRVGFDGAYLDDVTFKAMFEVGPNHTSGQSRVTEAWVSYNRFAPVTLQLGAFAQPANMDDRHQRRGTRCSWSDSFVRPDRPQPGRGRRPPWLQR